MKTTDAEALSERFRKLARLAKGNGHEGAAAAERAAAMLREHGDAVLLPVRGLRGEAAEMMDFPSPPDLAELTFRQGTRKWGTPEEKAALATTEAAERAAREAWLAAQCVAEKAEVAAERREAREERKAEKKRQADRERWAAAENAKSPSQKAAEADEAERLERATWDAERARRAAMRVSP